MDYTLEVSRDAKNSYHRISLNDTIKGQRERIRIPGDIDRILQELKQPMDKLDLVEWEVQSDGQLVNFSLKFCPNKNYVPEKDLKDTQKELEHYKLKAKRFFDKIKILDQECSFED